MLVNETLSEGLKRGLKVTIPASELDSRLATRLDELKSRIRIKGFRPGKVPVSHLRRIYGKAAMAEIVESVVGEKTREALSDRGERAATQPKIAMTEDEAEATKVLEGVADLVFTLEYEVLPAFDLQDFKGLKIERPVADVAASEIDGRLQQLAASARTYTAADRAAEAGDRVTFDYTGKTGGEAFESNTTSIVLGSAQFIPGFEDQLTGVKAGEQKIVDVTFPETYPAAQLAGKPATFDVTVKEVAAPDETALDDEFAKRLGLESVDKLRETIGKQIEGEYGRATRQHVKRQMLDQLDALYSFPLPENLVEQEFQNIWRQVTHDIQHHGKSFEAEGTSEEAARAEYRTIAERRVRLGLVLSRIGESAEIVVNDEELQAALYEQARRFRGQEKQVFEYYRKNPDALQALRAPIFEEKVADYILEFAEVADRTVSKEELFADTEDEDAHDHHQHDHGDDHAHGDHGHSGHDHGGHAHGDHDHDHAGHSHGNEQAR
jgi:trigger factor